MIAHAKGAKVGKGAQKSGIKGLRPSVAPNLADSGGAMEGLRGQRTAGRGIIGSARWRCCGSWGQRRTQILPL